MDKCGAIKWVFPLHPTRSPGAVVERSLTVRGVPSSMPTEVNFETYFQNVSDTYFQNVSETYFQNVLETNFQNVLKKAQKKPLKKRFGYTLYVFFTF